MSRALKALGLCNLNFYYGFIRGATVNPMMDIGRVAESSVIVLAFSRHLLVVFVGFGAIVIDSEYDSRR